MIFEGQSAVNFNTQKCDCVFRGNAVIFEVDLYSRGVFPDFVKTIALNLSGLTNMELELNQSIAKFDSLVNVSTSSGIVSLTVDIVLSSAKLWRVDIK